MLITKKNLISSKKLLAAILILTSLSCENIIDIDPPNNKINREALYKDITTTKAALNYLYSRLRDTSLFTFSTNGVSTSLAFYTDELNFYSSSEYTLFTNEVTASDPGVTMFWWDDSYSDIYAINAFIEGVKSSSFLKTDDKNQLLGEAFALRAIFYQNLAQLFGDIPYITNTDYTQNKVIGKTKFNTILEHIENDLLQSIDLLDYRYTNPDRIYINKAVVELLLSENYLLQKRYDLAEYYAQSVTENPLYSLEENLDDIFLKDSKGTLLQISPRSLPLTTPQALMYLFESLTSSVQALNPNLLLSFEVEDLRKTKWIRNVEINGITYHQPYKYKNYVNNTTEYGVVYRLERAYFYLAEALVNQEKILESIKIINQIRIKRGLLELPNNLTKNQVIDLLLEETRKEFFTEAGYRFFDLKRNSKLDILSTLKSTWKTYNNLFPISEKQIQINKNLLPNNPGY